MIYTFQISKHFLPKLDLFFNYTSFWSFINIVLNNLRIMNKKEKQEKVFE